MRGEKNEKRYVATTSSLAVLRQKVTDSLVVQVVILYSHLELQQPELVENVRGYVEADHLAVGVLRHPGSRRGGRKRTGASALAAPADGAAQRSSIERGFAELVKWICLLSHKSVFI